MTEGSLLTILKDSPAFKVTLKHKIDYACRALLTKNIRKESKIWVAEGSTFYSPLSMIAGSQFLGSSNTKYSMKIGKKFEIAVWHIYWDQVKSFNHKKTGVKICHLWFFLPTAFPYSNGHVLKVIHNFFKYSWSYSQSTPQSFHYRVVESPQCIYDRGVVIPPRSSSLGRKDSAVPKSLGVD